eukprot:4467914-Amphidinium_carterae.1
MHYSKCLLLNQTHCCCGGTHLLISLDASMVDHIDMEFGRHVWEDCLAIVIHHHDFGVAIAMVLFAYSGSSIASSVAEALIDGWALPTWIVGLLY